MGEGYSDLKQAEGLPSTSLDPRSIYNSGHFYILKFCGSKILKYKNVRVIYKRPDKASFLSKSPWCIGDVVDFPRRQPGFDSLLRRSNVKNLRILFF